MFPDEIHRFLVHRSWVTAHELTSDFFDRHLGVAALMRALSGPEEMSGPRRLTSECDLVHRVISNVESFFVSMCAESIWPRMRATSDRRVA